MSSRWSEITRLTYAALTDEFQTVDVVYAQVTPSVPPGQAFRTVSGYSYPSSEAQVYAGARTIIRKSLVTLVNSGHAERVGDRVRRTHRADAVK